MEFVGVGLEFVGVVLEFFGVGLEFVGVCLEFSRSSRHVTFALEYGHNLGDAF